ncbi:hypothetical protein ANN_28376 [Periplaneta americana]|uniref:Per a allergen n=1 Tax=Periplaneta americana TaxID=6978 RepID=A0ABQ8TRY0_PERAM|nr:hypothetical protein ANN_28376 [Periplaneta americana]
MGIRNLKSLSLGTSIALFKLKVAPVASYAIEIIWTYLSYQNLKTLDRAKSRYIKRTLCISKFAPTRLVYQLAGTTSFIEDLMATYYLTPTPASTKFFDERRQKAAEIDPAFFRTPAMNNEEWKAANFELRHHYTGEQSWFSLPHLY